MYVAQLDRSWLETPFMFQGFEVKNQAEIDMLRQYCEYVYVDVYRSSSGEDTIRTAVRAPTSDEDILGGKQRDDTKREDKTVAQKLVRVLARLEPSGLLSKYLSRPASGNLVSTAKEAPRALEAYENAAGQMQSILDEIRNGTGVNMDHVRQAVTPIVDSVLRNQDAMAWLVYLRKLGDYAYNHAVATSVWAVIFGRHLGFDRGSLNTLAMGGMLLDVGKTKIPDSIINKPGQLTAEEKMIMLRHVAYGVEIVKRMPGSGLDVLTMVECHHERHDGSGYPEGLAGQDIPMFGRIAGLVDCYDAMISDQPHKPAKSAYDAVRILNLMAGTKFQAQLIEQFVQALGMFPTGSLVELNTGEIGIVIEQNRVRRLRPKVMLVLGRKKQPLRRSKTLDLQKLPCDEGLRKARWIVQGHEPGAFGIDPAEYFL